MSAGMLDIRPLAAEDGLMIWGHWGQTNRLNVCFSGIGAEPGAVQPYEFADTATMGGQDNALFISDTERSWFNAPGLIERVVAHVESFARAVGARVIRTLGHSMGGYMALILPAFTKVHCAVGMSPQISVDPAVAGDDPRWMRYRSRITSFRIHNVMDHLTDATRYVVLHGRHKRERFQRDRFEVRENLTHIIFPSVVHEVPQKLREQGLLRDAVQACFSGRMYRLRTLLAPLDVRFREPGETPILPPFAQLQPALASSRDEETSHDQV